MALLPPSAFLQGRDARRQASDRLAANVNDTTQRTQAALALLDEMQQRAEKAKTDAAERERRNALAASQEARTVEEMGWKRAAQPDLAAERKQSLAAGAAQAANLEEDRKRMDLERERKASLEALPGQVGRMRVQGDGKGYSLTPAGIVRLAQDVPTLGGVGPEDVGAEVARQQAADAAKAADTSAEDRAMKLREKAQGDTSALGWARLKADKEAAARKGTDGTQVERLTVQNIFEIDDAIGAIDNIAQQKRGIDTGILANGGNWIAQKFGIDDPAVTKFKAQVGEQLAQYIKSISGAAVSDSERAALMQNVPTASDNDTAFSAKLDAVRQTLARKRDIIMRTEKAFGRNVANAGQAPAAVSSLTLEDRAAQLAAEGKDPAQVRAQLRAEGY